LAIAGIREWHGIITLDQLVVGTLEQRFKSVDFLTVKRHSEPS
jgi:hypothetical protein